MSSIQQRDSLQRQIWSIANDVRGSVDGWDFKQYVLGTLFYRFISENFSLYIEGGEVEVITYENQSELIPRTIEALDRAIEIGFESGHVALLSFRGRESSVLTPFNQIGKHTLRSPIQGKYDEFGNPEYSEGDITTDSVHRFKGLTP